MFQFDPALQPKRTSRTATPRALVAPAEEPTDPASSSPVGSASARKYQVDAAPGDADAEGLGILTGLPSARTGDGSARKLSGEEGLQPCGAATNRPARRTLRGSLHYLKHESVLLTRALVHTSRHLYRHLSLRQLLAYLLVLFGLLSETFTPAPRHNVPIGIVLFMTASDDSTLACPDHRLVVAGLCVTALIDFAWLLRPQEGAFNGFLRVQVENATHLSIAMCAAVKLWLVFAMYFGLGPEIDENSAQPSPLLNEAAPSKGKWHRAWSRFRFLFPRKTLPRRSHLSYEVLMRVLSLVWIHGVCGFVLLVLGLVSVMGLSGKAAFRSSKLGLPLPLAMLFKSASTLLTYVLATQNLNYHGCLTVSGCDSLASYYEENASDVVLRYNAKWMRCVRHAKVVDALLGVYLLAVFYSAVHSTTFIAGDLVLAVLVLTAIILIVLDVWTPLLILVVARCGTVLHHHHQNGTDNVDAYYPNQLEWEEETDVSNTKKKKKNDRESSSSSSSSSDGESSGSSSSGSGSTDASRLRRQTTLRRLGSKSSSRARLVPPIKRAASMLIIDAYDLNDREDLVDNTKPYWVRYWDHESGRSYLVHGLTNETVWEIGGPTTPPIAVSSRSPTPRARVAAKSPRATVSARDTPTVALLALPSPSTFPPMGTSRKSPRQGSLSARMSSHPTSESDVIVTTPLAASSPRVDSGSGQSIGRRTSSALLGTEDFVLLWDGLPDGGNFTCRVSRVPTVDELRYHLHAHGFSVASDGLSNASLRTIHFYAIVGTTFLAPIEREESLRRLSGARNASVAYFLGEFVFDSLSLKLFAKFRCPEVDAIVPFVKKLQLKEIVGAYAPCE